MVILQELKLPEVIFSNHGLREGLLYEFLQSKEKIKRD